jgi:hypothetical protein
MHCDDCSKAVGDSYGAVGIMGAEAITSMVLKPMRLPRAVHNICGAPRFLGFLIG